MMVGAMMVVGLGVGLRWLMVGGTVVVRVWSSVGLGRTGIGWK